ncbi:MAG: hypothetical protein RR513_09350 [Muribaculaceae bacterium]
MSKVKIKATSKWHPPLLLNKEASTYPFLKINILKNKKEKPLFSSPTKKYRYEIKYKK